MIYDFSLVKFLIYNFIVAENIHESEIRYQ